MSQFAIDQVLAQIRTMRDVHKAVVAPSAVGAGGATAATPGVSFADALKRGLEQVNQTQQAADRSITAFERGAPGVELAQVMVDLQKANVALRATAEVRNRFVAAYQEIMNMPI
jgi:flagellar hook-basal body complex protein FliE